MLPTGKILGADIAGCVEAIIKKFDVTRPYSNIINAETRHIEELLPLFSEYKVTVPANDAANSTAVPATLTETFAIGVDAEKRNIAMYEAFLKENLPDDVRDVFENLREGSVKHLAAFERGGGLDSTGAGQGSGNRGNRQQSAGQQSDPNDCLLNQAGPGALTQQPGGNPVSRGRNGRGQGNGIS